MTLKSVSKVSEQKYCDNTSEAASATNPCGLPCTPGPLPLSVSQLKKRDRRLKRLRCCPARPSRVQNKSEVNDMPVEEVCMSIAFPNESREYREARDALFQREIDLQRQMEAIAAQRRSLPPGGEVPEDYVFVRIGDDGAATTVRMSELFGDNDTLMLYHYMFPRRCGDERPRPTSGIFSELPPDEGPCPSCTP